MFLDARQGNQKSKLQFVPTSRRHSHPFRPRREELFHRRMGWGEATQTPEIIRRVATAQEKSRVLWQTESGWGGQADGHSQVRGEEDGLGSS